MDNSRLVGAFATLKGGGEAIVVVVSTRENDKVRVALKEGTLRDYFQRNQEVGPGAWFDIPVSELDIIKRRCPKCSWPIVD